MASDTEFPEVPPDFPKPRLLGAIGGAAPKILLVRTGDGKYAAPPKSDEEWAFRWRYCEHLAGQMVEAAARSKAGKRSHMTEEAILAQYVVRMKAAGWGSNEELTWIGRRTAELLNWALPESFQPLADESDSSAAPRPPA